MGCFHPEVLGEWIEHKQSYDLKEKTSIVLYDLSMDFYDAVNQDNYERAKELYEQIRDFPKTEIWT